MRLLGLCLHVFTSEPNDDDDPEEIAECDVGHYSDFGCFRETIARHFGTRRFPTLMDHSECDGEWPLSQISALERELREIAGAFELLPPEEPQGAFEHTSEYRVGAKSLYDCFHNVSGVNLFEAILGLCDAARQHKRPITFM